MARRKLKRSRILQSDEIQTVLSDLNRRGKRSRNARMNLIIFRLSCCCGLRAKELTGLVLSDLILDSKRPVITIRPEITKAYAGVAYEREVPLWWDTGTLDDIKKWREIRRDEGASPADPVVGSTSNLRLTPILAARRWKTVIRKALGEDRNSQLSLHCGRHSFCSHALAAGRSVVEVQEAAGHSDAGMTLNVYSHKIDKYGLPDVFEATSH